MLPSKKITKISSTPTLHYYEIQYLSSSLEVNVDIIA